jgi:4-amino-4-deoxychorismate lyase
VNIRTNAVYNGDVLPQNEGELSFTNRAFQYGDGLFETIRYEAGHLWFWSDHFDRLSRGMHALRMIAPTQFSVKRIYQTILQLLDLNGAGNQPIYVKLQVWRKPGGLYTPTQHEIDYLITTRPGQPFSITEKEKLGVFEDFRLNFTPVSAYKTVNALPYVLAGMARLEQGVDDVILFDTDGNLSECLASNLFWYKNQILYTPSLQTGCIDGIIRKQILRLGAQTGLQICQGLYKPEVLNQAEAVFCTNAAGVQWFRKVDSPLVNGQFLWVMSEENPLGILLAQLRL